MDTREGKYLLQGIQPPYPPCIWWANHHQCFWRKILNLNVDHFLMAGSSNQTCQEKWVIKRGQKRLGEDDHF